jgi:nuclear transport factor 2 (NTF2) superfamily protein
MPTPIVPPFTLETAIAKARMAEDAWNSRDPDRVALAYTEDSHWRNRAEIFQGRDRPNGPVFDHRAISSLLATDSPVRTDCKSR